MQVNVSCNFPLTAVAPGLVAAVAVFSLTDATGQSHSSSVGTSGWPTARNADGSMDIGAEFVNLPAGTFSGTVQMTDSTGNPVGSSSSFSAPSNNSQFTAGAVTVVVS